MPISTDRRYDHVLRPDEATVFEHGDSIDQREVDRPVCYQQHAQARSA